MESKVNKPQEKDTYGQRVVLMIHLCTIEIDAGLGSIPLY